MGREPHLQTAGENRLTIGCVDRTGVGDIRTNERNAPANFVCTGRAEEPRSCLHGYIADSPAHRWRGRRSGRRTVRPGRLRQARKEELRVRIVQQPAIHEVFVQRQRRGYQCMRVHLTRPAKDDAVLVDDVNLPFGPDAAENLRGNAGGIIHLIEGDPLIFDRAARRLIKDEVRLATDIEGIPVQQSLLSGLLHGDDLPGCIRSRLRRKIRPGPKRRIGCRLERTRTKTVRHNRQTAPGAVLSRCRSACLKLELLDRSERLGCAGESILGIRSGRCRLDGAGFVAAGAAYGGRWNSASAQNVTSPGLAAERQQQSSGEMP